MLDSRDINRLRPDVAKACQEVISRAKAQGINIIITSTVRDDEFQNKLYQQGRTTPGKIVTQQQKPTFHWCKTGLAFDFCPVDANRNCLWSRTDLFTKVGNIATDIGLSWGGNWTGFRDMPHIEWDCHGKYSPQMVRALQLPPIWNNPNCTPVAVAAHAIAIAAGDTVRIKSSATQWAKTTIFIPEFARTKVYRVAQVDGDKALLAQINSWVYTRDVERA